MTARSLHSLLIGPDATIREAMAAVDRGASEIALVVDDLHLVGTVSDGDLRRALLAGQQLSDPVLAHVSTQPHTVAVGTGRAQVLDLMRALSINQIPVVDADNRIVDLHLLHDLLGHTQRPNWAVLIAGGGHLAPRVGGVPKPMQRVAGRPILERILIHLVGSGMHRFLLCTGSDGGMIVDHFGDGSTLGCSIDYLPDSPDGASAARRSLGLLRDMGHDSTAPVLVVNGDVVSEFSVENLFASHEMSGAMATIVVHDHAHVIPFGVAETSGSRLTNLVEKPTHSWLVEAGIYVLNPLLLHRLPPLSRRGGVAQLLSDCLDAGEHVGTWHLVDQQEDRVGATAEQVLVD